MLRLILNEHSRIAIPEETWFFPDLYKKKEEFLSENWQEEISKEILELNSIHFPQLKPSEVERGLRNVETGDWPEILNVINRLFASSEGKVRWGDKTPGYVLHLGLLKKLYPNARIIHIIRDARDVVPSLLRYESVGPQTNSVVETAYYWKKHVSSGVRDGNRFFKDQYLQIRFEDLILETEQVIITICDFIGEEFESQMLEFNRNSSRYVPQWSWHKQVNSRLDKGRVALWKKNLDRYDLALIELCCRSLLKELKYPLSNHFVLKALAAKLSYDFGTLYRRNLLKLKVFIFKSVSPFLKLSKP